MHEGNPDVDPTRPEQQQPFVIETWQLDDGTVFNFALCDHDPDNMALVAEGLRGNQHLLLEALGRPLDTTETEATITSLLATDTTDPEQMAEILDQEMPDRPDDEYFLFAHLGNSHMAVKYIDLPRDHPDHSHQEQRIAADTSLQRAVAEIKPIAQTAALQTTLHQTVAKAFGVRDAFTDEEMFEYYQQHKGEHIGVMLGGHHFGALQRLGARLGIPAHVLNSLPAKVEPLVRGPNARCLHAMLTGQEISPAMQGRALLNAYGSRFAPEYFWGHRGNDALARLSPEDIQASLEAVDQIANSNLDYNAKQQAMSAKMQEIARMHSDNAH